MADNVSRISSEDFPQFLTLPPPIQRAAYSDRTAWLMAAMSELAYVKFESQDPNHLQALAADLAHMAGAENIESRLRRFREAVDAGDLEQTERLRAALSVADFQLACTFHHEDTEGFLAYQRPTSRSRGMSVLSFRGTTSKRDWLINLQTELRAVESQSELEGRHEVAGLHAGFVAAFESVERKLREHLSDPISPIEDDETEPETSAAENGPDIDPPEAVTEATAEVEAETDTETEADAAESDNSPDAALQIRDLPLYICGHSLGGALAIVATWKLESRYNAACYTFGGPRVGNSACADRFKTPIYRIVNGADPVPFIPPTNRFVKPLKFLLRWLPFRLDWAVDFLIKRQGYRHYGDMRYLHRDRSEIIPGVGPLERLARNLGELRQGASIVRYHDIGTYRRKLRGIALRRNQGRRDLV
jgi:triacylglycerol lipase